MIKFTRHYTDNYQDFKKYDSKIHPHIGLTKDIIYIDISNEEL